MKRKVMKKDKFKLGELVKVKVNNKQFFYDPMFDMALKGSVYPIQDIEDGTYCINGWWFYEESLVAPGIRYEDYDMTDEDWRKKMEQEKDMPIDSLEMIINRPSRGLATSAEADPLGKSAKEAGSKLDAGKIRMGLVLVGFARALKEVARVGTFGANKYTDNGWMSVPNGQARYTDALYRHLNSEAQGETHDVDSNLLHAAHAAWNALARLDLMIRESENDEEEYGGGSKYRD